MERMFAERRFVIAAPRERIWDLIGRVTIDSLNLEGFNYEDERNFTALIRAKVGFISLPMHLKGEIADITPPQTLVTVLKVTGLRGMIRLSQKVTYTLNSVDTGKPEVSCKSAGEMMRGPIGIALTPVAKGFAMKVLADVEKLLRHLA